MAMKIFSVFFFALLFLASPFLQVARCQSEAEADVAEAVEGGDLGIVGEDVQDFGDPNYSSAPEVKTVCVFPKNSAKYLPSQFQAQQELTDINKSTILPTCPCRRAATLLEMDSKNGNECPKNITEASQIRHGLTLLDADFFNDIKVMNFSIIGC